MTETDPTHDSDVVVLGAGPAGCAAAILLARRAHRVSLVRPASPPAGALAESIPPSARRVLDELGALEAVAAAGLHPNRGNTVWWAGRPSRREEFSADAGGFHTDRATLEEVLTGVAERAGVTVHQGHSARHARRDEGRWTVTTEGDTGTLTLRSTWLVDATGRKGLLARPRRTPDRSTTTLALVRKWRRPGGWPEDTAHHTLVESYDYGWAWSVPLSSELRCFTAMIDQRRTDLEGGSVDEMLESELDRTEHLGPMLEGATPVSDGWACPASLYTASSFVDDGLLLAGDAGSFIDPLSSFGVKKALSSGWLAGIVAHTALVDPDMTSTALTFFDGREKEVYRRYRSISAEFFAAGADAYGTRYWSERARAAREAGRMDAPDGDAVATRPGGAPEVGRDAGSDSGTGPGDALGTGGDPDRIGAAVPEDAVRRAFEEIKTRSALAARTGETLRIAEGPAIEGHRIVLQERLVTDRVPEGLRFVRGVDLARLVEVAPRHPDVPDGWGAYNALAPPVTLPDYLTALATAFAAEILEHGER